MTDWNFQQFGALVPSFLFAQRAAEMRVARLAVLAAHEADVLPESVEKESEPA